jgi:hypothetical protein
MTTDNPESTNSLDLQAFEEFGKELSARRGLEAMILKYNAETGEWTAGKDGTPMNGKKLVADIADLMKGWRSFKDRKPIHAVVRVEDRIPAPRREDLGDTDKRLWDSKQGDPWKFVAMLPLFDPETHETFMFTTSTDGGAKAVNLLVDAFVVKQRPPRPVPALPIVELGSDSYINNKYNRICTPILDIIGWTDRPVAVKRSLPPPMPNFITVKSEASPTANVEHDGDRNEPPPYSNDELNQIARENDGRGEYTDGSF